MNKKKFDIVELTLIVGIIIFLNIIATRYFFRLDLTTDRHFSLAETSKELLTKLNQKVYVEVFLDGALTPDYERLKRAVKEKLDEISIYSNGNIQYRFTNPNAIEDKKLKQQYASQLVQKGIEYRYERIENEGNVSEQLIFPSALISSGNKEIPVMFLKGNKTAPIAEQLNQSVEVVEYQLMAALRKLDHQASQFIGFVEGHDELQATEVADLSATLSDYYHVNRIALNDSNNLEKYGALVIAKPIKACTEKEKFILDQYVVKGGSLLLMIDPLNLNVDSLLNGYTYALPYELNLNDLFFKWGIRCNPNIVQDINSGLLQVATGNKGQMQMVNWNFHPIIHSYGKQVMVKNLDAILSKYPATIDTVKAVGIIKTPLMFTSPNTKILEAPLKIDLNETRKNSEPKNFQQGVFPIAYLLEGQFQSLFKNRPSPLPNTPVATVGKPSRIVVCTDADIIRNDIDKRTQRPIPLGFDVATQYQFSNKEFIVNAIDYLMHQKILDIRNKEIALRPLDKVKVNEEKIQWQIINLIIPPILLLFFGIARYYWRKRKFENYTT
jgi:ABC-2 type transport system permease protein